MSNSFRTAVKWAFMMNWGRQIISALVMFALAALLGPEDFGIAAMGSVYVAFVQMLLEQGFGTALVQTPNLEPEHLDSIFWLNACLSVVLMGISVGLSQWWAAINHTPKLAAIICALSLLIPIGAMTIVQQALAERKLDFRLLAIRTNMASVCGGAVGLGLALAKFGVWSLVGQQIAYAVIELSLLWGLSDWRPRLRFSFRHVKELAAFSMSVFAARVGIFINNRSDVMFMGLFFGPTAVGVYRLADRMMNLVLEVTTRPLTMVALPHFSRLQNDATKLRSAIFSCLRATSILSIPAMGCLAACADSFASVLGHRWSPAGPVIEVLCIVGIVQAITLLSGPVMMSMARPGLVSIMIWSLTAANTTAVVTLGILLRNSALQQQVCWLAGGRAAVFFLVYGPINLILLARVSGISIPRALRTSIPSLLAGFGAFFAGRVMREALSVTGLHPLLQFSALAVGSGMSAAAILSAVDPRFRTDFLIVVRRLLWERPKPAAALAVRE